LLIVFEMTHEFALVPALMVGALVSQAISRRMSRHNFYDALLVQHGHRLEHLVPPRDLREWQERPVTTLMTPRPVVATSLEAEALRKLLRSHPYERFPVMLEGRLSGVLTRQEAETAWKERRPPRLQRASVCGPTTSIREAQRLLLDSPLGMLVVCDGSGRVPVGILTLHDLLRAQIAWAEGTALPEGLGGFRPGRGVRVPGGDPGPKAGPRCLAVRKHDRGLMPLMQAAHKPRFEVTPAESAFGGHTRAVMEWIATRSLGVWTGGLQGAWA
jgi:CBS domain-containing protein